MCTWITFRLPVHLLMEVNAFEDEMVSKEPGENHILKILKLAHIVTSQ